MHIYVDFVINLV